METLKEKITGLNELLQNGKLLDAFEKYYHEDVSMQENELPPTVGKEANRQREQLFLENVIEFRAADVLDVTTGDGTTMVKWHFDYTHREWGVRNYTLVSVQNWKDGKIIKEQFFYGN